MPDVRLIGAAILAVALFAAGWTAQGWRAGRELAELRQSYADAALQGQRDEDERQQVIADAFAMIDEDRTKERAKDHEEIESLRAAVDGGTVRLRVAARCPPAGLPAAAAGARLGDGAAPDLAADARPAYFALRSGLAGQEKQLRACQDLLRAERRAEP